MIMPHIKSYLAILSVHILLLSIFKKIFPYYCLHENSKRLKDQPIRHQLVAESSQETKTEGLFLIYETLYSLL